jgi:hypothetical protein
MCVRCGSTALRQERRGADRCVRSRHTFYIAERCASDMQNVLTRSRNTIPHSTRRTSLHSRRGQPIDNRADYGQKISEQRPFHSQPGKTEGR